jgi:hypothetical protein
MTTVTNLEQTQVEKANASGKEAGRVRARPWPRADARWRVARGRRYRPGFNKKDGWARV